MILDVETTAGPHGDPEPLAFRLGGRRVCVEQILDRWIASDHSYFKLHADGATWILRHDSVRREWELTLFRSSDAQQHG